jgi:protein farnesyltransferase subunit beta
LQRIVSTLQHCVTEVPVEFEYEEVVTDCRLRELLLLDAQKDNTDNTVYTSIDGDSSGGDGGGNDPSQQPIASSKKTKVVTVMGGGFGGGPQQLPHVATTYAAVLALSIVAGIGMTEQSKSSDDHPYHEPGRLAMELLTKIRLRLYAFFLSLREEFKNDNNKEVEEGEERKTAFRMHHDGEIDVRASYCILTPCYLLGLLNNVCDVDDDDGGGGGADESNDYNPLLSPSIPRYIASCQTFEGGFGAEPFNEAHGGYTFCALAALRILNAVPLIDVNALSSWLARRQMSYEGGFCGRTNKLVDGCYSFWQGGAVAVLDSWLHNDKERSGRGDTTTCSTAYREISFDEVMLQRYILLCAQDVNGGLRDKPSKPKDFYHSCYNLSGLSVAQHVLKPWPAPSIDGASAVDVGKEEKFSNLFGDTKTNIIGRTDPVINIREERVQFMRDSQE